jgi:hypothetical protein
MHLKAGTMFWKCFASQLRYREAEIPDNRKWNTKLPVFLKRAKFTKSSANALLFTAILGYSKHLERQKFRHPVTVKNKLHYTSASSSLSVPARIVEFRINFRSFLQPFIFLALLFYKSSVSFLLSSVFQVRTFPHQRRNLPSEPETKHVPGGPYESRQRGLRCSDFPGCCWCLAQWVSLSRWVPGQRGRNLSYWQHLVVKDFDYFIRCSDDRVWTREFWRQFNCNNLGPHPDALASEVCNMVFEDLSVCVFLVPFTSLLQSAADPRKESPQSAYELVFSMTFVSKWIFDRLVCVLLGYLDTEVRWRST